jgi:alpha-1,3-glucosyltransferase
MRLFLLTAALKVLLVPSYFSTDFEVHRNWMAITRSLPINQWYYDTSSPNSTLDYPPLFAFFEWILSNIVMQIPYYILRFFNPSHPYLAVIEKMLDVKNGVNYAPPEAVGLHRFTVILSDLILYWSLQRFASFWFLKQKKHIEYWMFMVLTFCAPGLLLVDHIHFQYNGMLFGILVYSICLIQEVRY